MKYLLIMLFLFAPFYATAIDISPQSGAQKAKKASRFTLSQWMQQKGNMRWQDMWLAKDKTPSKFEFYMGAFHRTMDENADSTALGYPVLEDTGGGLELGAFSSIFGFHFELQRLDDRRDEMLQALVLLRLFGTSDQGTNLTAFYGLYSAYRPFPTNFERFEAQTAGMYFTMYLGDRLALQGSYQQYFKTETEGTNIGLSGQRTEASMFIEYGALRLFGTWYDEPLKIAMPAGEVELKRTGIEAGIRIYLDIKK